MPLSVCDFTALPDHIRAFVDTDPRWSLGRLRQRDQTSVALSRNGGGDKLHIPAAIGQTTDHSEILPGDHAGGMGFLQLACGSLGQMIGSGTAADECDSSDVQEPVLSILNLLQLRHFREPGGQDRDSRTAHREFLSVLNDGELRLGGVGDLRGQLAGLTGLLQ